MSDAVVIMWGLAFLIAVVGCVPYGIWIIFNCVQKRWKRLSIKVAIPLVTLVTLVGITWVLQTVDNRRYYRGLFDAKVSLRKPLFRYNSERSFQGDGYSISVFEMPARIRNRFESADDRLLSEFPKHPEYRDHWSFERWRGSPFDEKFTQYLDFALSSYDSENEPDLEAHFAAIRRALNGGKAYYSFSFHGTGWLPSDIDFFVVDLERNRLYLINHNT